MSELSKYEAYQKKLQGICDENNLVFRFRKDKYPITLTIRPVMGLEGQMSMLESVEENGYISPTPPSSSPSKTAASPIRPPRPLPSTTPCSPKSKTCLKICTTSGSSTSFGMSSKRGF